MRRRELLLTFGSTALACSTGTEGSPLRARRGVAAETKKITEGMVSRSDPPALRLVRDKLAPLHHRTEKPKPGDWLYDHPEGGQTFEEYLVSEPTRPTPNRRTLVVAPLGEMPPASLRIVERTTEYLGLHFGLPTRVAPAIALDPPSSARREKFGSEQFLTRWILDRLLPKYLPDDAAALIGFTATDLWPGENWNFVFGEATFSERVGVWSLHRFGDPSAGADAERTALLRALKIAVHETGHMFSLPHCTKYPCVQAGTNSMDETDLSPLWLCPECLPKIAWVTATDPRARLAETSRFCAAHGLKAEAAFLDRSLAALEA
ncbi:MAG: hypothetical protein HOW73_29635 [Polyangiaceae bacterium]|nr:hypothetical protein [Polyangiaceae bacterium]